jgi:curli biogenesis system outer membrane secretion channel CsgG
MRIRNVLVATTIANHCSRFTALLFLLAGTAAVLAGPKHTVMVAPFGTTSHFQGEFGQTDVGGGLAAMLTTALTESGAYIVVERAHLSNVLAEQELSVTGLARGTGNPLPGALVAAQFMIVGEVTEFSDTDKTKGLGFGIGLGNSVLNLAPQKRTGAVALDLRIVDTRTAEIVEAVKVRETTTAKATAVSFAHKKHSVGSQNFARSPLGQAARKAIDTVVARFAEVASQQPWSGTVVDIEGEFVTISAGAESGLKVGDRLEVRRVAKVLTDPVTGRVLGRRMVTIGEIVIASVEGQLAYARLPVDASALPGRGDVVLSKI